MKTTAPPDWIPAYARTAVFPAQSTPENLCKSHGRKAGTRARSVALEGRPRYRILEPELPEFEPSPNRLGVVEPQLPHEVEGDVRFYVKFCC